MQIFKINGKQGETGSVWVRFDDGPQASFTYSLDYDNNGARLVNKFMTPMHSDAKTLTVGREGPDDQTSEITRHIFDLAQFTNVLLRQDLSFCRRVLKLNYALQSFVKDQTGYGGEPSIGLYRKRLLRDDKWLASLQQVAAAHGTQVPAAFWSFAKLNMEPQMGGGIWATPGQRVIGTEPFDDPLMPNVVMAKSEGSEWARMRQEPFDVLMALYEDAICVAGDANHFSGVIWHPVGLTEDQVAKLRGRGDRLGPDGTFWRVRDDNWRKLDVIRDDTGAIADADFVMREVFRGYFLINLGQALIDAEAVPEDTVFLDSTVKTPVILLHDPNHWCPVEINPYDL